MPTKKGEQRFYKKYAGSLDDVVIGEVRSFEPLKAFFSRAREIVAEGFRDSVVGEERKPLCIVGVKACDLKGFKVQDHVFSAQGGSASGGKNHDDEDPFYIKNRQENLIISADCTCAIRTCFCLAVDVRPYPEENFDLNLSQVQGGFIISVGSPRGQKIIDQNPSFFEDHSKAAKNEQQVLRKKVTNEVEENIQRTSVPRQDQYAGIIEKGFESEIWSDEAKTCVECAACNAICPTCHCFLLYDQKDEDKMARLRIWDSCMIKDFARVAGGANPRPKLWMRLRNRFEKKFDFFPKVAGVYACTGCGRCITACPAKIDIRRVLKRLVEYAR
ncbi:MAG: 4Fe-4S dicluster domain-containing protein [Candidatus Omnitrophota bacterium]